MEKNDMERNKEKQSINDSTEWKAWAECVPGAVGIYNFYEDDRVEVNYLNDSFYSLLNSTRKECSSFTGFDIFNDVFPADRAELIKKMRLADMDGTTESIDVRCVTENEQYRWFHVRMRRVEHVPNAEKTVMCLLISAADDLHKAGNFVKNRSDILKIVSQNGDIILWEYDLSSKTVRNLYAYGSSRANKDEKNCGIETFIENGRILPADSKLFIEMYHKIDDGASVAECTVRVMNDVQEKYEWQHMVLTRQEQDGLPTDIVVGFSANIELQKEAEVRYERENRLRQELVKDAVIYYRINLSNHMVEEMYSEAMDASGIQLPVSLDQLLEDGLLDGCYELDREKMDDVFNADKMLENYLAGKRGESFTYRRYMPGKGLRWLRASIAKLKRVNTDDVIAFFTANDVDDEMKDQILYRDVMNEEIECLTTLKVDTMQVRIIKENRTLPGYDPAEGKSDYMEITQEFYDGVFKDISKDDLQGTKEFADIARVKEELERVPILQHVYSTKEENGRIRRKKVRIFYLDESKQDIIFVRRDITDLYNEQQRQSAVLKRAMEETKAANEAKSVFLSHMSHDMRTPLNAILGYSGATLRDGATEKQKDEFLDDIYASGEYLLGIINDVLDMSKIESNKMVLHLEPYTGAQFKDSIETVIGPLCEKKDITFVINDTFENDTIAMLDKVRFNQIFINILSNAVKFTPAGGIVSMKVQKQKKENGIQETIFAVSDTGCGMSPEFLPHVFDSFSQEYAGQVMHNEQGTGLGLSIVKQLVELMDGNITVESELGKGTTFTVYLPIHFAGDEPVKKEVNFPKNGIAGLHLLLCEDHPLNRKIAVRMLEKEGCSVDVAEDGVQGVQLFKESPMQEYDAILMDIRMPHMDGLQAARTIRALPREDAAVVPIIAMTANAFVEDRRASIDAGMNAHVSKPIDPMEMYNTIYRLTASSHITRTPKILIVDDIEVNAIAVACALEEKYDTIVVHNGFEALDHLAANPYIVAVITDIQMPDMDGDELISAIRRNPGYKRIAIIANTEFGDRELEEKILHEGADDFIYKPTSPSVILSRVQNVLQKYR